MGYTAYERETVINMNDSESVAYIETYQKYWRNRILKAKEKRPDEVVIVRQTDDMIEAVVPRKFIKISAPRLISEEQRLAAAARFRKRYEASKNAADMPCEEDDEELGDESDEDYESEYEEGEDEEYDDNDDEGEEDDDDISGN